MKYLILIMASVATLSGCNTLTGVGQGLKPNELAYRSSIRIEPPSGEKVEQVDLNEWLWQKISDQKQTAIDNPSKNVGCVSGAGVYTLLHCFSNIRETKKKIYRNNLVSLSLYLANSQCNKRIDGIGGYLAGGNTLQSVATDIVGSVGIVSTDAITSRIASGVGVGVKSLWDNSKTNFVAGSNFGTLTAGITQERKEQSELLAQKMDMTKPYSDWPLESALIAIDKYDNSCDLFN